MIKLTLILIADTINSLFENLFFLLTNIKNILLETYC